MTIATLIGKLQEDISWLGYNATEREIIEHIKCAITLLKAQEAQLMTLDELTEIYVEFKGDDCLLRLTCFDLQKIIVYVEDGICRLWTGKPTEEQRKLVKWE